MQSAPAVVPSKARQLLGLTDEDEAGGGRDFTSLVSMGRGPAEPAPLAPVFSSCSPPSLHGSSEKALALLDADPSLNKASVLLGEDYHVIERAHDALHRRPKSPSPSASAQLETLELRRSDKARALLDADPSLHKASTLLGMPYYMVEQACIEIHSPPHSPPQSPPLSPRRPLSLQLTDATDKARALLDADASINKAALLFGDPYHVVAQAVADMHGGSEPKSSSE